MTVKNLINTWSLPDRTQERQQITLRLNYDLYAKLHALKEVYPSRTVNDMINDILKSSLDEIIEALPVYTRKADIDDALEMSDFQGGSVDSYIGSEIKSGPGLTFQYAYLAILNKKSEEASSEEAA